MSVSRVPKFSDSTSRVKFSMQLLAGFSLAAAVTLISFRLSDLSLEDLSKPLIHSADTLVVANTILATFGNSPFLLESLSAPEGQRLGYSAFGIQWIQSSFAGALAGGSQNPWLAMNLYMLFAIFSIVLISFLGSRLLGLGLLPSTLIAGAMAFAKGGAFGWVEWPFLQHYSGLILSVVITILFARGLTLFELSKSNLGLSSRAARSFSWIILVLLFFLLITGDNYYMWFSLIITSFVVISQFFLRRPNFNIKGLYSLALLQILSLIVTIGPIALTRVLSGLGISESSTGDRRAFAALANGGELPSLFLNGERSLSTTSLRNIGVFENFLNEYNSSSLVVTEGSRAGISLGILLVILAGFFVFRRFLARENASLDSKSLDLGHDLIATLAFLVLAVLLYLRGGLGLAIAFGFPYLRGFDRIVIVITFLALISLGLIATRGLPGWSGWKSLATVAIVATLIDGASNSPPVNTDESSRDNGTYFVAGQSVISDMVASAGLIERELGKASCNFLVLPVTSYPVDFSAGVVSYDTYETIKPALSLENSVAWTSGAIPGTPGSHINQRYRELFHAKDYERLYSESRENGACGIVVFGSLQTAMHVATDGFFDHEDEVLRQMQVNYPDICFRDDETRITLLCKGN